jgi:PAS domain S-box-containing protein
MEKVKTEKSRYARSLIEASLDPLFTISLKGKITDLNKASADIIGDSRENIIGTDFFGYFTEPLKAREVYKDVYKNGFVTNSPLTLKDDKQTDVLFNGSVYKDEKGKVIGVVVVARDITEQKRISNELNESIAFAESATNTAEQAKRKAERATIIAESAVKAKQQFLSNMSHEIRTPMNAIIGFTKVLLKTDLSPKQKEYLSAIKMSGDALIVLINDILDLAKVDAGKMTFEETSFRLSLSLSAMIHLFETKIMEKNLRVFKQYDNTIPDVLVGDPVRLHQIILNLVDNAVKFTNTGKITVSAQLIKEDEKNVIIEFSVADTGIGIPDDRLDTIFENFQQASSETSRLYGGTGLGLAIVKNLVNAQGGSIEVKSQIGAGTTFSFTLSFKKPDSLAEYDEDMLESEPELQNIRILVVEDILLNQLLMKTLLDDFDIQRDIAENGKVAIEMLKNKKYDVVLMDLHMPVMNGFEATEYIRNEMKSDIPIIALTADVTTVDMTKCKLVGMNDYIAKPVDEKLLYSKIASVLKRPGTTKSIPAAVAPIIDDTKSSCINLDDLIQRTKSNPEVVMAMIKAYIDQTPPLIIAMNESYNDQDWSKLYSVIHKMIPSFTIMGISKDFEDIAREVQDYASARQQSDGISDLVAQLSTVCTQACSELEAELDRIKKTGL